MIKNNKNYLKANKMNLGDKINLYFFDPYENEDKYSTFYRKITKQKIVAYSPLYMLRRHILFISGQLPENNKYKQPYFSAIILSNIAVNGLLELLKYNRGDRNSFYLKYLGKNPEQVLGLKILRNALEHNNFMLFTRLDKSDNKTKYYFNELRSYFINKKKIRKNQNNWINYFKVTFSLYDSLNGAIVLPPNIEKKYYYKHYILVRYDIAPFDYLKKFEQMFNTIKIDILHDKDLKKYFDETITADNWMKVYNP